MDTAWYVVVYDENSVAWLECMATRESRYPLIHGQAILAVPATLIGATEEED